jgi:hypothetical protein
MDECRNWLAAGSTVALVALSELSLLFLQRRQPARWARAVHAQLREDWFQAVSGQAGSEILAVQTLRNSLMSATMLASTTVLALMGTLTLSVPSLHAGLAAGSAAVGTVPRMVLVLALLGLLFVSLVATLMAVRFYNHASFIAAMPVDSPARASWASTGVRHVRKAGILYGVGLRQLVLVLPVVAALLVPVAGPAVAAIVAAALFSFDVVDDRAVALSGKRR